MKIVSLNIGRPVLTVHDGRQYSTAINRRSIPERIRLTALGFAGDRVADNENHGGPDRAACCYSHEHYSFWAERLEKDLPIPSFGENLTTEGLLEREVCIGDTFRIGSALVQVTQPRQPCWKLANKLEAPQLPKWITELSYTGFYVRVLEEGEVQAGDAVQLVHRPNPEVTVALTAAQLLTPAATQGWLARLAELPELSNGWRARAAKRLSDG